MADVKWIKITTDMFDNKKIKYIRKMPEGNNIVLIWVMLLTMAGNCNANGMIFLTENIPYTTKMLADELGFEENIIIMAVNILEKLNMVLTDDDVLRIPGWEEHQNVEGMERIREQTQKRVQKHREKQKLLASQTSDAAEIQNNAPDNVAVTESNVTCNVTVTKGNAVEREEEKEEEYITVSKDTVRQTEVRRVIEQWNSLSVYGIAQVSKICANSKRYKNLTARIREYGLEEVLKAVENVKSSKFLQGKAGGSRQWMITFDWFVLPSNFPKVLEGYYTDRQEQTEQPAGFQPSRTEAYTAPEEDIRGEPDRFSCLEPEIRRRLEEKGVIQGQTLVLGDATEGEIKYLQDCGVL